MKISILDQKHPDYDADEIAINRALYGGGKRVKALIDTLLHKGADEPTKRYEARKLRAYYVNHCAGIVDQLVSWLFSAHPSIESNPEKPDSFWEEFRGDCDLEKHSLHQFQAGRFREAFITGRAWTLCELPGQKTDDEGKPVEFASLADEDKAGAPRLSRFAAHRVGDRLGVQRGRRASSGRWSRTSGVRGTSRRRRAG
jgi:hypothetical protein